MKSIMHSKAERTCYLCMELHGDYTEKIILEEHHAIYGHGRRANSTKYGLIVYLCPKHHRDSPESVHGNTKGNKHIGMYIKCHAERAFMSKFPNLKFREIFGKHYLSESSRNAIRECISERREALIQQLAYPDGFIPLEDEKEE